MKARAIAAPRHGAAGWWAGSAGLAAIALAMAVASGPLAWAAKADERAAAKAVEINVDNFAFKPAEVTISPGTTIRWINHDEIPHTIVDQGLAFKSSALDTDESYTHVFAAAGEITYFCSLHPHMIGRVIVQQKQASVALPPAQQ